MDNFGTKFQSHDHLYQQSFSFSSFDFNSSLGIFSDNDDHENDEAYIEITLKQNQEQEQTLIVPQNSTPNNDHMKDENLEFLHLSFSSSVCSFPGFSSSTNDSSSTSSLITTSTIPSSLANTEGTTVLCINNQNNNKRGTLFKTLNRLVDALFFTLKLKRSSSSSPPCNTNGCAKQNEKQGSWELVRSSKAPSKVNGGARKLLTKFRSINILSMVVSFVKPKPRQVIASSTIKTNIRTTTTTSQQEAFAIRNHSRNSQRNINKQVEGTNSPKLRHNSRLLEINLESITKIVEGVSKNIVGKSKQSKSCPGSIKASPVHQERIAGSSDNSVQAAIAHCKQSFGQNR